MRNKKGSLAIPMTVLVAAGWLLSDGSAQATQPMQKKAKEAGIAVVTNCQSCHVAKLPKKGASDLNDMGKWLTAEKEKRSGKEVDVAWLKDYKPAN